MHDDLISLNVVNAGRSILLLVLYVIDVNMSLVIGCVIIAVKIQELHMAKVPGMQGC
jgi:hypothetical protein